MKVTLRAFNKKGEFLAAVAVEETTSFEERADVFKKIRIVGMAYWCVEDQIKEFSPTHSEELIQEEKIEVRRFPLGEPQYSFTFHTETGPTEEKVYLTDLEDKHKAVLLEDIGKRWDTLPYDVQLSFMENVNRVIQEKDVKIPMFGDKPEEEK